MFGPVSLEFKDTSEFLNKFYIQPFKIYFVWLAAYGFIKFVICGKYVMDGTWGSTWGYFKTMGWV